MHCKAAFQSIHLQQSFICSVLMKRHFYKIQNNSRLGFTFLFTINILGRFHLNISSGGSDQLLRVLITYTSKMLCPKLGVTIPSSITNVTPFRQEGQRPLARLTFL